jgi:hypothetical protein
VAAATFRHQRQSTTRRQNNLWVNNVNVTRVKFGFLASSINSRRRDVIKRNFEGNRKGTFMAVKADTEFHPRLFMPPGDKTLLLLECDPVHNDAKYWMTAELRIGRNHCYVLHAAPWIRNLTYARGFGELSLFHHASAAHRYPMMSSYP